MSTDALVYQVTRDGTLVAPSSCGLLAVPDLLAHVQQRAARGGPVVIDLSAVVAFDMAAFRSLVWAHRYCRSRRVRFAVVAPPPGVFNPREEAILRELMPVYTDSFHAWNAGTAPTLVQHQPAGSAPVRSTDAGPGGTVRDLVVRHPGSLRSRADHRIGARSAGTMPEQRSPEDVQCSVKGCSGQVVAGGRCRKHHLRWRRYRVAGEVSEPRA